MVEENYKKKRKHGVNSTCEENLSKFVEPISRDNVVKCQYYGLEK